MIPGGFSGNRSISGSTVPGWGGIGGGAGRGEGEGGSNKVESLLVDGKKEEAVNAAVQAGMWGLAILVATQCPPAPEPEGGGARAPQQQQQTPVYQRVVRQYADSFLHPGTPLHTMALAFSGQAGEAIRHGGKSLAAGMGGSTGPYTVLGGGVAGVSSAAGPGGGGGRDEHDRLRDNWMVTAAAIISNKV
ncbi:unnamed protein product [Discosporangium mesarthrocarpum]